MPVPPTKRYAYGTTVVPEQSEMEIKKALKRYGVTGVVIGEHHNRAAVMFEAHGRRVRFDLPEPKIYSGARGNWREAETRRLWRSLLMLIKAKLEIAESGISTFETEMLPYTIMADGRTFAEAAAGPEFETMLVGLPTPMLPGGP